MTKKDKLFTEELARRNPDWEKFVAVHNEVRRKLDTAVEALEIIRDKIHQAAGTKKIAAAALDSIGMT